MAKKRKSSRKTASREVTNVSHELPGGFWRQVLAVFLIVLAVALVVTWFGEGGSGLNLIHTAALNVIGFTVYVVPAILVFIAVKIFRADGNRLSVAVWIATVFMILWLSGIFGLPTLGQENPTGGFVGMMMNAAITSVMNPGIAAVIYVVLILITSLFIAQTSPLAFFRAIVGFFKGKRNNEDQENALLARKAQEETNAKPFRPGALKINTAKHEDAPALAVHQAEKNPEEKKDEPQTAIMSVSDPDWEMPTSDLFEDNKADPNGGNLEQNAAIIKDTYLNFGIDVEVNGANVGPRITQYTMTPPQGISLAKITAREKELGMNLAVDKIRIEAPIPGTRLVGVEVPNPMRGSVTLRDMIDSPEWQKAKDPLTFVCGRDISGRPVLANLAKMPHLLIAGTTGSGKSVMTTTLISSLLYRNAPADMKMIIIDPKTVDLVPFNGIPHLLAPVITDVEKAISAMKWAVTEMERRYACMSESGVRKIDDYNKLMAKKTVTVKDEDGNEQQHDGGKMPYIVIIVDEMSDLMGRAGKDLEQLIVRIAQMGRASGIHLVLATQRPEVKVITGLIKANVPARIAFTVQNNMESRIILGAGGAEKLLGEGDMLLLTSEMMGKAKRVQGAYSSDLDVNNLVTFLRSQREPEYNKEVTSQHVQIKGEGGGPAAIGDFSRRFDPNDPLVRAAVELTISKGQFATSMLQTHLGKGHGYVSGLAIWLEQIGVIGPVDGHKPREVYISSMEEFDQLANAGNAE